VHQLRDLRRAGHHVTLGVTNTSRHRATVNDAQDLCDTLVMEDVDTSISTLGALRALVTSTEPFPTGLPPAPYTLRRFIHPGLAGRLIDVVRTGSFDVIHVDYLAMAWYAQAIRSAVAECPPILLRAHNVEYRILEHTASDRTRSWLHRQYYRLLAGQTARYETAVARAVQGIATVSEPDAQVFRGLAPETPVVAITPGMDLPLVPRDLRSRSGQIRIGMLGSLEWTPNVEGAIWFVREVLPRLLQRHPELQVHIAGRSPVPEVKALHTGSTVIVHGPVESASDFLGSLDIVVVPVLSGSGVRIKVLEGLANGCAMVSTSLGAEGLAVADGEQLLIADGPERFADACLRLINDEPLTRRLGQAGRTCIEDRYSWPAATAALEQAYASIAFKR